MGVTPRSCLTNGLDLGILETEQELALTDKIL